MDEKLVRFVIEKLVSELNAEVGGNDCDYIEIYQDEVDEINELLDKWNMGIRLKSDHDDEEE
jgi:hypothetical protein